LQFPELLEKTIVPERKFAFQTAALQHRITAAPKIGWKGQVFPCLRTPKGSHRKRESEGTKVFEDIMKMIE